MKKYIFILLILLIPTMSFGAIVVSGNAVHGSSLTITDTTDPFGAKATAAPKKWETFELNDSSAVPVDDTAMVPQFSYWTETGLTTQISTIDSTEARGKSAKHTKIELEVVAGVQSKAEKFWKNGIGLGSGKIYINYWTWFERDPDIELKPTYTAYQVKTITISDVLGSSGEGGPEYIAFYTWTYNYPSAPYSGNFFGTSGMSSWNPDFQTFPADQIAGRWYNVVLLIDQGTLNTSDGSFEVQCTTPDMITAYNADTLTGIITISDRFDAMKFGWFATDSTTEEIAVDIRYDDIYMDNSWARVEIGDNADYSLCKHREIQIPTSWAVDEVSITVNQGSFSNGDYFLHVTLEDGTQLPSVAVTFAAGTAPIVTLQADKEATSPTTYTGSFTVETGRTATTVVSSNGFTVTCDDGDCTDETTEAFTVSGVTVPITDVITVTDSSAETGNDSITITLPTPATSVGTMNGAIVNGNFR